MSENPGSRFRRWFLILPACSIALTTVFCVIEQGRGAWKLQQRRAALLDSGQPLSISEIMPSGRDDVGPVPWAELTSDLSADHGVSGGVSRSLMKAIGPRRALALWNDPEWMSSNRIAETMSEGREALQVIHSVLARDSTSPPLSYHEGYDALIPHLSHVGTLREWLASECLTHMSRGNHEGVLRSLESMGNLAGKLENDLVAVCQSTRLGVLDLRSKLAWAALAMEGWDDALLERLQRLLEPQVSSDVVIRTLQMERAVLEANFFQEAVREFDGHYGGNGLRGTPMHLVHWIGFRTAWSRQDKWRSLLLFDHLIEAHQVGLRSNSLYAAKVRFRKDEPGCIGVGNTYDTLRYLGAHVLQHGIIASAQITSDRMYEVDALRAMILADIGIRRYRIRESGGLPDSLAQVGGEFGSGELDDLVSGVSLRYLKVPAPDEWIVYSIGRDAVDQGGEQPQVSDDSYLSMPVRFWDLGDPVLPKVATIEEVRNWRRTARSANFDQSLNGWLLRR